MYRQKSNTRLKMVSTAVLCIMTTMCFMAACQPTPDKDVVIGRDNAEKIIFDSKNKEVMPYDYDIPSEIKERFSIFKGRFDVVVDAPVDMPSIKEFPVAKVKAMKFDKETADRIIDYFAGDCQLVAPHVLTKQDYDEWIVEEKRGRLEDGEYIVDEQTQQSVAELEKKRDEAPEEDTYAPITGYTMDGTCLKARIIKNGETVGTVYANESLISFTSPMRYRPFTVYINNPATGLDERTDADYHIKMTVDEARRKAEELLSSFGISGFEVKETTDIYYYEDDLTDIEFGGYSMVFMRSFGGMMPLYTTYYSGSPEDSYEYCPPVKTESIEINIDEYGKVQRFSWQHPIEIVETITDNVELLPFEEIMQRLREFARQHWAWLYNESKIPASANNESETPAPVSESVSPDSTVQNNIDVIKINNIALNLSYIPLKNSAEEFMYAPCWVFEYEHLTGSDATDPEEERPAERGYVQYAREYIILNAIDGGSVSVYPAELARQIEQGETSGEITLPISVDWYY